MPERKKTITEFQGFTGKLHCTPPIAGMPYGRYIFQYAYPGSGNMPNDPTGRHQVKPWKKPTNPQTPTQQAPRMAFAAGVEAWHVLSSEKKLELATRAANSPLNAYQLWLSEWMRAYHLE